ncbi:MAG TPA: TIGR03016 family PEP-CTERM system-associated outer membrane protein [Burkholderiales bacterium]|nr:TIGR03016 family PEP-CTERM system-associated outer membrane protein [Burkholderiales bacterium]
MAASAWHAALATAMLLTTGSAALAQTRAWTISPSITLRETYNDNVALASTPQNDWITQVTPGINISGRSRRLTANVNYTADFIGYARNHEHDRLANTLSAFGNFQAIDRFLFIDAQGNVNQTYISPFAPRPSDNTTITANRFESRTWSLSPYVRSQLPGGYTYEVRNRNSWTRTDADFLAKIHSRQWTGSLASPISLFGWALEANDIDTVYDDPLARPERKSRMARARLFFQPDPTVRLYASAGRQENNFILQQEMQSYRTYGYGGLWRPTPRTTAQFDWERQFFGVAKLASLEHRMRMSAFSLSYSKNVSTFPQEVLRLPPGSTADLLDQIFRARIPDPVERQQAVQQFLRTTGTPAFLASSLSFFTEQVFLQERLQGSFALLGVRNSISFTAFRGRTAQLTDTPAGLPSDVLLTTSSRFNQHGFGANASHRLTPFTSLSASANRIYTQAQDSDLHSTTDTAGLNISHAVSTKTDTFGGFTYTHFETSTAPTSQARAVFVGLSHRF